MLYDLSEETKLFYYYYYYYYYFYATPHLRGGDILFLVRISKASALALGLAWHFLSTQYLVYNWLDYYQIFIDI